MSEPVELWIARGKIVERNAISGGESMSERQILENNCAVKIILSEAGTLVRWSAFSANWSSLYLAKEWIFTAPAPFTLNYYLSGWFTETHETALEASSRIDELIHKSDVHLSSSIYITEADSRRSDVPSLLKMALKEKAADEEHSIDCIMDPRSGKFRVQRVGPQSSIAKFYGLSPISYPCLTGHSYDQEVSRVYPEVTRTGVPHYDHVYAAMASPDGEVMWIPYQRVVLPLRAGRVKSGVRVVTEMTKVDISPL